MQTSCVAPYVAAQGVPVRPGGCSHAAMASGWQPDQDTPAVRCCAQVAMGIGHALFLVDPAHAGVAAMEAWEPEEKTCEPVNVEGAGDAGAPAQTLLAGVHEGGCCFNTQVQCCRRPASDAWRQAFSCDMLR